MTTTSTTTAAPSRRQSIASGSQSAVRSVGMAFVSIFAAKTPCAMKNEMIPNEEEKEHQYGVKQEESKRLYDIERSSNRLEERR